MRLFEFAPKKPGGNDSQDVYILLNFDLDNRRRQAFVSIHVVGINNRNLQILQQAVEDQHPGFEELGRDLGIFRSEEINHTSADQISRSQFPEKMYDMLVQAGPTISAGWLADAADLPFE